MDCVDLFSGCGGMSLGFQNAGFNIKAAFDNWQTAVDIYSANFDHPAFKYDLYDAGAVPKIEEYLPSMIIGGPPCQDFSIAGARQRGKRANLTIRYAEIVRDVRPE